jgi:hypothetical protein
MKSKLVLRDTEHTSFHSPYLQFLWQRYFDIEYYDPNKTYDRVGTVFVVSWQNVRDDYTNQLTTQGHRVAVDNLWEFPSRNTDYYWIQNQDWFWYNESMWWRNLGYHRYQPNKTYSKQGLMLLGRSSHLRDKIVDKLNHRLDDFVWSYRDRTLPNDLPKSQNNYQRFFNPQWYDDTYFSLVVETVQHGSARRLTEKIFKPMAYRHPFLLIGPNNALKNFHELGFETFENIFDESYDDITNNFDQKLNAVIKNIDNFVPQKYDAITLGKLQHNHAHFFDRELVESRIVTEIIEPLIHYAETR